MEERKRTGFEYIDLEDPSITEGFRFHPGSNPKEIYVARLRKEGKSVFVEDVYRLITRRTPHFYDGRKELVVRRTDNRNLAVKVTEQEVVDTFRRLYEDIYNPDEEDPIDMAIDEELRERGIEPGE